MTKFTRFLLAFLFLQAGYDAASQVIISSTETGSNQITTRDINFVHAEPMDNDSWCQVLWCGFLPGWEISYDDGDLEEIILFQNPGNMHAVRFTPHGYPLNVHGGRIFVGDGSFPGPFLGTSFQVLIFDDDGENGLPGTALDSMIVVVNNYGWVEFTGMNVPVTEGDFYLAMKQLSPAPDAAPVGVDTDLPTWYRSYTKLSDTTWQLSVYQDIMIRAWVLPVNKMTEVTDYYQVDRFSDFDPEGSPLLGDTTSVDTTSACSYSDTAWGGLPQGFYAYGVREHFTSGEWSDYTISNIVAHQYWCDVSMSVELCDTTWQDNTTITLNGNSYPYESYSLTGPGALEFENIFKGTYTLIANAPGNAPYMIENATFNHDTAFTITMQCLYQPSCFYQADTGNKPLILCPPLGPPFNFVGFNLYIEGSLVDFIAPDITSYFPEYPVPCNITCDLTAVYDLTPYGFPGEYGESPPLQAEYVIRYGFDLEFTENWDSGNFDANQWTIDSPNWSINSQAGNPAPAAAFTWDPNLLNYEKTLTSYPLFADGMSEGSIWFDYDYKLVTVTSDTLEFLNVQLWNWTSQTWVTVRSYNNGGGNIDWTSEHLNISNFALGQVFRIRFQAAGENTLHILGWLIDNVSIYRVCPAPRDLEVYLDWWPPGIRLNWLPPLGHVTDWLHWDNGSNYGSIGLSGIAPFTFDVAARWDAAQIAEYYGTAVTQISFFSGVSAGTAAYRVRVWVGPSATLVVDQPVASVVTGVWNTVTLTTPVPIDVTQSLWVGYQTTHGINEFPAGYDQGPAVAGYGDMIYFNNVWQTLSGLGYSYNWNIAAYVQPMAAVPLQPIVPATVPNNSSLLKLVSNPHLAASPAMSMENGTRSLTGYNIWRSVNFNPFSLLTFTQSTTYLDQDIFIGYLFCYKVLAVYEGEEGDYCESALTEQDCVIIGIDEEDGKTSISIYPNPASDHVYITSGIDLKRVTVYNALGQPVFDQFITGNQFDLKTMDYKSGVYLVRVETATGVVTRTFVIQR